MRREDPEQFLEFQSLLKKLIVKGLPAEKFWDSFVQCTDCNYVMPRQYYPYYHPCVVQVVHRQLGVPKDLQPTAAFEETIERILEEDYGSDEEDLSGTHAILAPTSKTRSLPWVDPSADIEDSPERPTSRRR